MKSILRSQYPARSSLLATMAALSMSSADAAPPALGCTSIGCVGRIQEIYIDDADDVFITPPEGNYQNLTCTLNGGQYFKLSPAHKKYREIHATLTAALVSQSTVNLRITTDATGQCLIRYVVVYRG